MLSIARVSPVRLLLWLALVPLVLVPAVAAVVARLGGYFVGHVQLVTRGGSEVPLPTVSVWVLFGISSALLYLLLAAAVGAVLRARAARTRNVATLIVLALSVVACFVLLITRFR